jgi:hypothetical protein
VDVTVNKGAEGEDVDTRGNCATGYSENEILIQENRDGQTTGREETSHITEWFWLRCSGVLVFRRAVNTAGFWVQRAMNTAEMSVWVLVELEQRGRG